MFLFQTCDSQDEKNIVKITVYAIISTASLPNYYLKTSPSILKLRGEVVLVPMTGFWKI